MKKIKLLTLLMAAPMLWSCSAEDPMPPQTDATEIEDPNFVPLDEALKNADLLFTSTFGSQTRSTRNVKSVEFLGQDTRSGENGDAHGYYIVNYENDGGFALLSADRRLLPVYAFSDEGSLSLQDTIESEGLRTYINGLPGINIGGGAVSPPRDTIAYGSLLHLKIESDPLLHPNVRKWKETSPYNQYCIIPSTNSHGRAGSAAVAIWMFMSYHKQPKAYNGKSYDWDGMIAGTKDSDVAHLFKSIGNKDNMNIEYSLRYSSCQFMNHIKTLKHFGYTKTFGDYSTRDFSDLIAAAEIRRKWPVLVYGFESKYNRYYMWIMDGYATLYRDELKNFEDKTFYMHCIWGNGGRNDGYYHYDTNNDCIGPDNKYDNLIMTYGYHYGN